MAVLKRLGCAPKRLLVLGRALFPLLYLSMTGCGYHLRGMGDAPQGLDNVAIIIQQATADIKPLLITQLQAYHIHTNAEPSLATYWLTIESETFEQHLLSVSSSTTPRQNQLTYTVHFKLERAKQPEALLSSQVVVSQPITTNSNRILGSNDEEALIKTEMKQQAAIQIMNRMSRGSFNAH